MQANLAYLSVLFWTATPDLTVVIILIPVHICAYYCHQHCQGGYVMPHICLSVCPLATLCRHYWTDIKVQKFYVSVRSTGLPRTPGPGRAIVETTARHVPDTLGQPGAIILGRRTEFGIPVSPGSRWRVGVSAPWALPTVPTVNGHSYEIQTVRSLSLSRVLVTTTTSIR